MMGSKFPAFAGNLILLNQFVATHLIIEYLVVYGVISHTNPCSLRKVAQKKKKNCTLDEDEWISDTNFCKKKR
jgi:hypothetical protein